MSPAHSKRVGMFFLLDVFSLKVGSFGSFAILSAYLIFGCPPIRLRLKHLRSEFKNEFFCINDLATKTNQVDQNSLSG